MKNNVAYGYLGRAYYFKGATGGQLFFVTEVHIQNLEYDIVNETSAFVKFSKKEMPIFKFRVAWYGGQGKENGFKEAVLFEKELEEVTKLYYNEKIAKKFGDAAKLPFVITESEGDGQCQDKDDKSGRSHTQPKSPILILVDKFRNKEQSKFGNPTIVRPEFLCRFKWYDNYKGKFEEVILPEEIFKDPNQSVNF